MTHTIIAVVCVIAAYLLGSVPTGYLVARARGVDIQAMGSGNIGATNVLRSVGKIPALIVVVMDPLKGLLAVSIPLFLGFGAWVAVLAGIAVVLGNTFNVFLGFKGGKGIATGVGAFAGVEPVVALTILLIALWIMFLGRYVSLGALAGASSALPILLARGDVQWSHVVLALGINLIAFYKHRENLKKLAAGTERRLGQAATPREAAPPKTAPPKTTSRDAAPRETTLQQTTPRERVQPATDAARATSEKIAEEMRD